MQKAPTATVSAGPVAPTIMGPEKDMKDVYILSGLVGFLAIVVAAFWYYSQADEAAHSNRAAEALNSTQVSQVLKDSTEQMPVTASVPTTRVESVPLASRSTDILHDDIPFEVGRKGLTDDGKAALQRHAEFLKSEPDWGVLVQGYTDQQGSMSFNKILGLKRAETVKQQLIALGVPDTAIRTVSLGEEGALCIDKSDVCRRMNRRVHLEMRKIGLEHMVSAPLATEALIDTLVDNVDRSTETETADPIGETPASASAEADPAATAVDSSTGN
ncbi:MAG: OmpA family protein [Nitrospira sp.]|nr:OmpA family protein [Nitrospira sp.]MCW5786057.1 OmpA family protein [Nitrospira sp.]